MRIQKLMVCLCSGAVIHNHWLFHTLHLLSSLMSSRLSLSLARSLLFSLSLSRAYAICRYHIIEIPDINEADITPYFAPASHFIDTALAGQRKAGVGSVLVHCRAGVSRSTSLVLHWMMARKIPVRL